MDERSSINRLGDYLRARRALVTPEQAGLPVLSRRRVPGLREEVALLAGISADYYLRLERGRDVNPSVQVLDALARVLRLGGVERDHLALLAGPSPSGPVRGSRPERVPARLHHLLAALDVPAFVEGRTFDVLASNPLAEALSPRLVAGRNRLRSLVLDPEERMFHRDWETAVAGFVGAFRASIDTAVPDPRAVELVGELSLASARFRSLWARHDVRLLEGGTVTVDHPRVGELRLHRDKLPVDDVILVLYYPDAGSDAAEQLRLLASLPLPAG